MSVTWLTDAGSLAEPEQLAYTDSETWDNEKLGAKVDLKCPWADRYEVLANILYAQKEWPYLPGSDLRAVNGSIRPFDGSVPTTNGSGITYVDAVVNVTFEIAIVKSEGPDGGTAVYSESLEPSAEFLTLPYQDFRWGADDGPALKKEEAPGRLEIGLDYTVTWNNLRSIPVQALTLIGAVNTAAVTSPTYRLTFDAETLLFNPPKISRTVNLGGPSLYQMVTRLTYRKTGWNSFWRATTSSWERIHKSVAAGGGQYDNFELADMSRVLP